MEGDMVGPATGKDPVYRSAALAKPNAASKEAATKGPSSPEGETPEALVRAAAAKAEEKATADGAGPVAVKAAGEAAAKSRAAGKSPYEASRNALAAQKAAQKVLEDGMSPEAAKVAAERAVAARGLGNSPKEQAKEAAAAAKATQAALDSGASPEKAKAAGEAAGNAIRSGKSVVEAAGEDANKGKSPEAAKAAGESAAKARSAGKLPRVIANDEGSATELAVGDKGGVARSSKTLRDLAREQGLTVEDVLVMAPVHHRDTPSQHIHAAAPFLGPSGLRAALHAAQALVAAAAATDRH